MSEWQSILFSIKCIAPAVLNKLIIQQQQQQWQVIAHLRSADAEGNMVLLAYLRTHSSRKHGFTLRDDTAVQ